MKTTTTCADCGCAIPPAPLGDAKCTHCRYHGARPALSWDALDKSGTAPEQAGYQVASGVLPGEAVTQFQYPDDEPTPLAPAQKSDAERFDFVVASLVRILAEGNTPLQAGQYLHMLAFLLGVSHCNTQAELAKELNISPSRVAQIRSGLPSELQRLCKLNRRTANARGKGEVKNKIETP
jgi:hypothetical protein